MKLPDERTAAQTAEMKEGSSIAGKLELSSVSREAQNPDTQIGEDERMRRRTGGFKTRSEVKHRPPVAPSAHDERIKRRAKVRAAAASIVDEPRTVRHFRIPADTAIRASARRRRHALRRPPRNADEAPSWRRRAALLVLIVEVVALLTLLLGSPFQVGEVSIVGVKLLNRQAVLQAAGVSHGSLFTVDADLVRQRLLSVPWVRTATVHTELPGTVRINVVERAPVLRVHRQSSDVLVADDGATMDVRELQSNALGPVPLLIDERANPTDGRGHLIDGDLLATLDAAAASFPSVFGCTVAAFEWQRDGILMVWAQPGWRAVLGHVDTAQQIAAVSTELTSLADLTGHLNLSHPAFGYVDLEDPSAPAVGGQPGLPTPIADLVNSLTQPSVAGPTVVGPARRPSGGTASPSLPAVPAPHVLYVAPPPAR